MSGQFCHSCGASIGDDDVFCRRCGTKRKTDILDVPSDAAPEMEESRFCFNCGARLVAGGRFCHNCGVSQTDPAQKSFGNPLAHSRSQYRREYRPGLPAKKRSVFRVLVSFLLFLAVVVGACFAAYMYFLRDIPWRDVVALITGRGSESAREESVVPLTPEERELAGISMDMGATASADAEVSEDASREAGSPAPGEIPSADHTTLPPAMLRYAWSQPDESGFSQPVVIDQSGDFVRDATFTGVVMGNRVRMRAEPNTTCDTMRHFSRDALLDVVGRYSSANDRHFWFNVRSDGKIGWIYGEFLRVIESPKAP
ncbi:MAG: zinc ribbon domain-containing protein [Synergistaceae bacterium]|jgi:ribosomal protein L40E|nr:zinc ribbon domain-containing protein [Synergistaceae bacterium]